MTTLINGDEKNSAEEYKSAIADILNDCSLSDAETDTQDVESLLPRTQPVLLHETILYKLLTHPSRENLRNALIVIDSLEPHELNICGDDGSTYLHVLMKMSPSIYKVNNGVLPAIPVLYRLAIAGIDVNKATLQGNTALHLATVRPEAADFVQHLIRIGIDPALANSRQCTAFYIYSKHCCQLLKTPNLVTSGVWRAVCGENMDEMKKLITNSWTRVNCYRENLSLLYCAGETGNNAVVDFVSKYLVQNELIAHALACNHVKLKKMLGACSDNEIQCLTNAVDESFFPPKPLFAFLREFGEDFSGPVLQLVRKYAGIEPGGSFPTDQKYLEQLEEMKTAFEESDFYKKIAEGTGESLDEALEQLATGKVNVLLRSQVPDRNGWTFLHFIVDQWRSVEANRNPILQRRFVRLVYRLCLAGVDVNARSMNNETALFRGFDIEDPSMALHLFRCGADGSIAGPGGVLIGTERYEYQGRLVAKAGLRLKDIAGLWSAVEAGDYERTERWISSWCRVNAVRDERSVLDVARSLGNKQIIALLEKSRHTTELVSAALACDVEKVKLLLALGKRMCNLNPVEPRHYIGLLPKRCRIETIQRPFIVTAMEVCSAPIVAMLVKFGADLNHYYEEAAPCGPVAFWAFRAGIEPAVTMVIAQSAPLSIRDERGCGLLHRALTKPEQELKKEIVQVLIERGIDLSLRDIEGSSARDYITIYDIPDGDALRECIDLHILEHAVKGKLDFLENLVLQGYDHILSIRGPPKNRTITEHVTLKNLADIKEFLAEIPSVEKDIEDIQNAAVTGNVVLLARYTEKISIYGKDKGGRTLLHKAVMHEQENIVNFVLHQLPQIINLTDNLNRTALHYCAGLPASNRKKLWQLLSSKTSGCNPSIKDVNDMTAADYVKEMENETPVDAKRRGRKIFNYRVQAVIEEEKAKRHGHVYELYHTYHKMWDHLNKPGLGDKDDELIKIGTPLTGDFVDTMWNGKLLFRCIDLKMQDNALDLWRQLQIRVSAEALQEKTYSIQITVQERVMTAQQQKGGPRRGRQRATQQTVQMHDVEKIVETSLLEASKHRHLMLLEQVWKDFIAEEEKKAAQEEAGNAEQQVETATQSVQTDAPPASDSS